MFTNTNACIDRQHFHRDAKVSGPILMVSVSVSKAVVSVSMFLVSVSRGIVGLVAGNANIF